MRREGSGGGSGKQGREPWSFYLKTFFRPSFVLRTQDQLEMLKKSDCKLLSDRVMQRVVTFEKYSVKHPVNIFG